MNRTIIAVLGELSTDSLDLTFLQDDTVIMAGTTDSTKIKATVKYICANKLDEITAVMQAQKQQYPDAMVLAPRDIYASHLFHDNIECLPDFNELKPYDWNPYTVSQQLIGVALALWIGSPVVVLFDYLLEPKKESPSIEAMLKLYPNTKFIYVRQNNKNTIRLFDKFKNVDQMILKDFKEFYEKYKRSN